MGSGEEGGGRGEGAGLGGGVEGGGTFITDKDKQTDFSCFLWNNTGKWRSNMLPEVKGEKILDLQFSEYSLLEMLAVIFVLSPF
jgi:hypothetical protein